MMLYDGRYALAELPAAVGVVSAHDDLLDRPVELVVLEPIPDRVQRARLLRSVRRIASAGGASGATTQAGPGQVCPVTEAASAEDRPYLAVNRQRPLTEVLPLRPELAAAAVLEAVAGLRALRAAGLSALSLQPEHLRLSADASTVQVLPATARRGGGPNPARPAAGADGNQDGKGSPGDPDVQAAGLLLSQLLGDVGAGGTLSSLATRAQAASQPPVPDLDRFEAELRQAMRGPVEPAPTPAGERQAPSTAGAARLAADPSQQSAGGARTTAEPGPDEARTELMTRVGPQTGAQSAAARREEPPTREQPASVGERPHPAEQVTEVRATGPARSPDRAEPAAPPQPAEPPTVPQRAEPVGPPQRPEAATLRQPAEAATLPRSTDAVVPQSAEPATTPELTQVPQEHPAETTREDGPAPLYVPLSSLLHDEDEDEEEQEQPRSRWGHNPRQGPRHGY